MFNKTRVVHCKTTHIRKQRVRKRTEEQTQNNNGICSEDYRSVAAPLRATTSAFTKAAELQRDE
ncbi:hypothetical protein J6590_004426 [Homalodisca vitripennis]|nr:hypothetical protein J6590_004426 [Homalodisca vitripennis]